MGSGKFNTLLSILSLLMAVGLLYGGYRLLKSLLPGSTPLSDSEKETITNHSSDRMLNGNTYLQSAMYLYKEMYGDGLIPWLVNSDEGVVGNFMLTVNRSEYRQLCMTYILYKKEARGLLTIGDADSSLTTDLRDLFSSSDFGKYTSHLGLV